MLSHFITTFDAYTSNMVISGPVVNGIYIGYDDIRIDNGGAAMVTQNEWHAKVKGILKGELKRRNMSYKDLVAGLAELGVHESERNIANKLSRGGFTAVFFVQCLVAMGATIIRLND